jgi:hypothetical protein
MQSSVDLRLARHGAIVLLLGLLVGFAIGKFHERGVGDAAHLVGLIGGFGMIALSTLWPRLNLGRSLSTVGAWATVACMYLNWLGVVLLGGLLAPPLLWSRVGQVLLQMAVGLSLLSTLLVLFGLRGGDWRQRAGAAPNASAIAK